MGYYQVPKNPRNICKTAVITPFVYLNGAKYPLVYNRGSTFQSFMHGILIYLHCVCICIVALMVHVAPQDRYKPYCLQGEV